MKTPKQILEDFRMAAINAGNSSNSKVQNKAARQMQACYRDLCMTEEGRSGLIDLMLDSDAGVRLSAAARCLQWVSERAEAALETLRSTNIF
ncbi:MAG TPA: hypothetical protein VHR72_06895, partial [Gemmataceae bacterium]|nr:hypothetical protein [Gemmataceae bacterium]